MKHNKKLHKSASAGSDSAGMLHGELATRAEKRPKSKSELMRNTRANKKKEGLIELRLWLTPEQKESALKYVAHQRVLCTQQHKTERQVYSLAQLAAVLSASGH